jgi:hypothetical protein
MLFAPPAKASFSWWFILFNHFFRPKADFSMELGQRLGAKAVWVGDAWVPMLAEGLKSLRLGSHKSKVVLPAYSCNEFVKAILLADLEPLFVDIDENGKFCLASLNDIDPSSVLAVLAVNTSGVVGELDEILAWANQQGCYLVEDAGYTFLGNNAAGRPFGSWGHATIINMSEGKIIPCGGAAWAVKTDELAERGRKQFMQLVSTPPRTNAREAIHLAIYRLGSSRFMYHLYQCLRKWGLADWKAALTTEPSRLGENYATGDLEQDGDAIQLSETHRKQLESIRPRPWNNIRQNCALQVMRNEIKLKQDRQLRLQWWKNQQLNGFYFLPTPPDAMPVKCPVLIDCKGFNDAQLKELASLGIKKQYPSTWPMYHLDAPFSSLFYEQAYTLPVHEGILLEDIEACASVLKKMGL